MDLEKDHFDDETELSPLEEEDLGGDSDEIADAEEDLVVTLLSEQSVLTHPGYFYDFAREAYLVVSLLTPVAAFCDGVDRVLQFFDSGHCAAARGSSPVPAERRCTLVAARDVGAGGRAPGGAGRDRTADRPAQAHAAGAV